MKEKPKMPDRTETERGAVTFLDVLGWRGIWQRNPTAIETLHGLVQETEKQANLISKNYVDVPGENFRGKDQITKVLSISDTIAMFTTGSPKTAIEIQARICSWLLEYALKQEIPIRGALSYGEYMVKNNIMLGYAVDEAASWHEVTNWIGVVLTPSAQMKIKNEKLQAITMYHQIPFKTREQNLITCVDWMFEDLPELYKIITNKGPHTPEIAPKYLNTLAFLDRKSIPKKENDDHADA
ncbi:MAG: hypothetical protein LBL73_03450 [Synergistaceae bacterium]|jgi:hypothetical protein|nr:hypothetical protein [Synergistaceae bacterium]